MKNFLGKNLEAQTINNDKNRQTGLHQAKKLLCSKRNNKEETNRLGEGICKLHIQQRLTLRLYKELKKFNTKESC